MSGKSRTSRFLSEPYHHATRLVNALSVFSDKLHISQIPEQFKHFIKEKFQAAYLPPVLPEINVPVNSGLS